jgi:hypothetical protein
MLSLKEKIHYLKEQLESVEENYADSFKTDILFFINDFNTTNSKLFFLKKISSKVAIYHWICKLTPSIVLKFDEESVQINDFIYDFQELRS